jgi:hypothetical protein
MGPLRLALKRYPPNLLVAGLGTELADTKGAAIHILRGVLANGRIDALGAEAPALATRILSKDCPVSPTLTEDDKARLRAFRKPQAQARSKK